VKSFRSIRAWSSGHIADRVSWSFWLSGAAQLILAIILVFTPLLDLLGYEFCVATSLLVSITAGPVALGVLRKRLAAGAAGRVAISVGGLYLRALISNCLLLLLPLAVILLNALRVRNCNLATGLGFFVLLPVATTIVFTTWGTTIGLMVRRRVLGGLAYASLWILIAGYNIWEIWSGPQIDSYNQIIGWLAGPIYDEVVELGLPLIASRLFGMAWALSALFLAALLQSSSHNPTARRCYGALAIVCCITAFGLTLGRYTLGFGRSYEQVRSELSGVTKTPHFVIHHSPDLSPQSAALVGQDHEFRYWQLQHMLGLSDGSDEPFESYLFATAEQKRRLVGASRTQFTKPWQRAIYLNGTEFPHPVLKHELTHAVASAFGAKPFGLSAKSGLWINLGLTEGLATAAELPVEGLDLHTWSAAMRRAGQAPSLIELFSPVGFWTASGQQSYTLAGSFVLFLISNYGQARFKEAYAAGNLEGVYPKTLAELIADWEKFLDSLPLDTRVLEQARVRFAQPSIFARPCAHEISSIRKEVLERLAASQFERSREAAMRLLSYLPNDRDTLALLVEIDSRAGKTKTAISDGLRLLQRTDLNVGQRVNLLNRIGDLLASEGKLDQAREQFQAALEADYNRSSERLALIEIEALAQGRAGAAILDFLNKGVDDAVSLLALHEAALQANSWAGAWYLLGRQLFLREHFAQALSYLQRAEELGLMQPALYAENLRLIGIARYRTGDRVGAALILTALSQFPNTFVEEQNIRDWLERISFDELYGKLIGNNTHL
jgi:tetratricopeptide (TPR) repeat protein